LQSFDRESQVNKRVLTDSVKFPTDEIAVAQRFNFAPNFSPPQKKNAGYLAPIFAFLEYNSGQTKIFGGQLFPWLLRARWPLVAASGGKWKTLLSEALRDRCS